MSARRIRSGRCSSCGVAMESPTGMPEGSVPRSRDARRNGHCKSKPWRVIPDDSPTDLRDWQLVSGRYR